ncbi:AI-2E family transporter [Myceligenerans xiligouense]|uniref:AI-2E family transporter n=1 Tax=Myceligenerans xiligouense TaxID=253184 RepID=UPI001FE6540D|nr:AI-2E family transporter [Myceligenerans xiligouense]
MTENEPAVAPAGAEPLAGAMPSPGTATRTATDDVKDAPASGIDPTTEGSSATAGSPPTPPTGHPDGSVTAGGARSSEAAYGGARTSPAADGGATTVPRTIREAAAWSWRILLVGAALAAIVWLLASLRVIVVPVAVALLLAVMLTPVRRFLQHTLRVPRGLASGLSLLGLILAAAALVTFAGQQVATGFADLSEEAIAGFEELTRFLDGRFGLDLIDYQSQLVTELEAQRDAIIAGALGAAVTAGNLLIGALIALFCTFFFLHDPRGIWSWVVGLLPVAARERVHQAGRRGIVTLSAYTRTQILVAGVDAVGIGLGSAFFVPSLAVPIGVLVFVGSFIPMVGAIVTGAIATVVVLVAQGWVAAIIMLGIVILVQQIESHVLQPFLMGQAVSLHPVAVILAVAAGSFVAGIAGALFAVPLLALVNTVVLYLTGHDKFPELGNDDKLPIRWLAPDAPPLRIPLRRATDPAAGS